MPIGLTIAVLRFEMNKFYDRIESIFQIDGNINIFFESKQTNDGTSEQNQSWNLANIIFDTKNFTQIKNFGLQCPSVAKVNISLKSCKL